VKLLLDIDRLTPNESPHLSYLWDRMAGLLYRYEWVKAAGSDTRSVQREVDITARRLEKQGVPPMEVRWTMRTIADEARDGIAAILHED